MDQFSLVGSLFFVTLLIAVGIGVWQYMRVRNNRIHLAAKSGSTDGSTSGGLGDVPVRPSGPTN